MTETEHEQNLIIVAALDGYAREHGITALDAFDIFEQHQLFAVLRNNYPALHTQALSEGAAFANDYLASHS